MPKEVPKNYIHAQKLISQLESHISDLKWALLSPKKVTYSRLKKDLSKIKILARELGIKLTANEVLGIYDWYTFVGQDNEKYPIPLNYASKSKLIPGDTLKLTIMDDGELRYKLIKPASRKKTKAILNKDIHGRYIAITKDKKTYFLNFAAVSFFKWRPWDNMTVIINPDMDIQFAAIEFIIKSDPKDVLY